MGLREHIEQQLRVALRRLAAQGGGQVNVTRRVNKVVARNVDGGDGSATASASASAEQSGPIVQGPNRDAGEDKI